MTKPRLVIVSDWIRRDLHDPLRYFQSFEVVHLYRQEGYKDMKSSDYSGATAVQWHGVRDLWQKLVEARPTILQGAEPWANRASLLISFVTWWYIRKYPQTILIWPALENRPLREKFGLGARLFVTWWTGIYGRVATMVIYLNHGAKRNLLEIGVPEKKLRHLLWGTWGIDCDEFSPGSDKHKGLPTKSEPQLLFVGRVSEAKGIPWLLEAFHLIRRKFPLAKLMVGGPADSAMIELIKRAGAEYYGGPVKNQDLPALMRGADIVIAPSVTVKIWEEQVGMVIMQAMACGKPIVSTRSGAIPEFFENGKGTILVPERDSQAIAEATLSLLENPEKAEQFGVVARRFVRDHYEVRTNIKKLETVLQTLLGKE